MSAASAESAPPRAVTRGVRGVAAAAVGALAACARPPGPPGDAAERFVGRIYVVASNQSGPRSEMMMRVDRRFDRPTAPIDVRMMYGPGGYARSTRVDGDSLVVVWAAREGVRDYRFVIRPTRGDSVAGTWEGPEGRGTLRGTLTGTRAPS